MRTKKSRSCRGASAVEAAIALPVMLSFVMFSVDISLYFHKHARATDIVASAARQLSTSVAQQAPAGASCTYLKSLATYGLSPTPVEGVVLSVESVNPASSTGGANFPVMTVRGEVTVGCAICLFMSSPTVVSKSTATVETLKSNC